MKSTRGIRRRDMLLGAGVAVAALSGFTAMPESSAPRPLRAAPATAVTDPDLVPSPRSYADVPWDPESAVFPLRSDTSRWWLVGSSTAEYAGAHVAALAERLSARLYKDAKAGETDAQIASRMGLAPARLSFPGREVTPGGRVWGVASPLTTRVSRPYAGRVEGTDVTGVLAWDPQRAVPSFTRTDAGGPVRVPDSVRFLPTQAPGHRADLTLFLGGGKNSVTTAGVESEEIVAGWQAQHAWLAPQRPAFLRQGFFANAYAPDNGRVRENIDAVNAWGRSTLGARFLDIEAWLAADALWTQVGVEPTRADLEAQAARRLPPSLADRGGFHLRDAAAQAWVQHVVGPRILALGWA
ncbi:hypothetical protein [Galactobacter valiniphilus]|uniref:hypothetical protein n=1 Tax=Galactobacter valiniphilus TaxID=2676122 RepID=UPI003736F8F7